MILKYMGLCSTLTKRFRITLYAIYIDGCDASRNIVVQDREMNVLNQEWFPDLCYTAQFRAFPSATGTVKISTSNPFIDLHARLDQVLLLGVSSDEYGWRQLLFVKNDDHVILRFCDGIRGCFI